MSRSCPIFWYMIHMHKLSAILQNFLDPIWDINGYDNDFWNPVQHGVSHLDQKCQFSTLSCGTWYSHSFVWHILSILDMILTLSTLFLDGSFSIHFLIHHTIFTRWVREVILSYLLWMISLFKVEVCILIYVSYPTTPDSFTVFIDTERNIFL